MNAALICIYLLNHGVVRRSSGTARQNLQRHHPEAMHVDAAAGLAGSRGSVLQAQGLRRPEVGKLGIHVLRQQDVLRLQEHAVAERGERRVLSISRRPIIRTTSGEREGLINTAV